MAAEEAIAALAAEGEFDRLADALFDGPRGHRAVADDEGADGTVLEFQHGAGRVFHGEVALVAGGDGADGDDLAGETQEIDLVDEGDQDWTAPLLCAPGRDLEIRVRLVGGPDRRGADQRADVPVAEQSAQLLHLVMMAAMMADEREDAGTMNRLDQPCGRLQRVGHRLFDQDMDAAPGALDADLGVDLVGRGEDCGHRLGIVEQATIVCKNRMPGYCAETVSLLTSAMPTSSKSACSITFFRRLRPIKPASMTPIIILEIV